MAKRIALIIICASLFFCTACSSIIEGEQLKITAHRVETPEGGEPDKYTEVLTYEELVAAIKDIVGNHQTHGYMRAASYPGNLESDVERACQYVYYEDPLGAFALYYITSTVSRIVSYYEIEITATYKRTADQIADIIPASSLRYFQAELLDNMTGYSNHCAMQTSLKSISVETITKYIEECYYSHPLDIVVMPDIQVALFPPEGMERVAEVTFFNDYSVSKLLSMTREMQGAIQDIAGKVSAETDAGILVELCALLNERCEYDAEAAQAGQLSRQNTRSTAYGAVVEGAAVGEGYAMAYKALCDEFSISCRVVRGRLDGIPHAWNIVRLDGDYYHIDIASCDVNGIDTAFLLRDTDMSRYWWDTLEYEACTGQITYASLIQRWQEPPPDGSPEASPEEQTAAE